MGIITNRISLKSYSLSCNFFIVYNKKMYCLEIENCFERKILIDEYKKGKVCIQRS